MKPTWRTAALALAFALPLAACGDDSGASAGGVDVQDVWARTTPGGATAGAAYMVLEADDGDRLLSASVDPGVAGTVELHETVAAEDDEMTSSTEATMGGGDDGGAAMGGEMGAMTMRPIDGLDLPAGEEVALASGGYHVMLLDLAQPLAEGSTFTLTLDFERAGSVAVDVPVRDSAP